MNSALILKTIPVSPCSPTRPVFFIHPWVDVGGSKPTSYMDRDLIWWAGLQRRPWGEVLIEVLEKRRIDRTERVRCDFTFSTTACCLLTWVWCCKWSNRNTNFCVCMKKSHEKVCKKKNKEEERVKTKGRKRRLCTCKLCPDQTIDSCRLWILIPEFLLCTALALYLLYVFY